MRAAILFVVLLCASACSPPLATITGEVRDIATGDAIAGALVFAAGGADAVTDAHGRYALPADGARELRVEAAGYLSMRRLAGDGQVLRLWPEELDDAAADALHETMHAEPRLLEGDVRPEMLEVERADAPASAPLLESSPAASDQGLGQLRQGLSSAPLTIRVWRRRIDGSTTSCTGRVDVIPFEEYIKGVLPHEWIASWDRKSLRMGAVAIRSYAWVIVASGGRYQCADVDDTSNTQVYRDEFLAKTDDVVDETRGQVIVREGKVVLGQYSAENGDPTAFGVSDPHCAGKEISGHRRGTCQRGTQRWATLEGRDHAWMTAHYYPGATLYVPPTPATTKTLGAVEGEAGTLKTNEAPPDEVPVDEPHDLDHAPADEAALGDAEVAAGGCAASPSRPLFAAVVLIIAAFRRRRRRRSRPL